MLCHQCERTAIESSSSFHSIHTGNVASEKQPGEKIVCLLPRIFIPTRLMAPSAPLGSAFGVEVLISGQKIAKKNFEKIREKFRNFFFSIFRNFFR